MFILKKLGCRIFQTAFRAALPILPYREPKIVSSCEGLGGVFKKEKIKSVLVVTDKGIVGNGLTEPLVAINLFEHLQICGATINKEPWARSKLLLRAFLHKRKTRESPCETRFFCYSLKLSVPFCTFVAQSDTALRKSRSPVSQMITLLSHRWPTISAVEKRAF